MTGYGRGQATNGDHTVFAEVRTVNHRFLDIKLRGGSLDPALEEVVTANVRRALKRGSVSVTLRVQGSMSAPVLKVNHIAARRAHGALAELARSLSISQEVPLALISQQPGVLVCEDLRTDDSGVSEELKNCVTDAVVQALTNVGAMRETEGRKLAADLQNRFKSIGKIAAELKTLSANAPEEALKRLTTRLEKISAKVDLSVDEDRVAQEVAIFADRMDITEELVRVDSHLDQCSALLKSKDSVGRRFDFLIQELGREFNTVGSKSQSAEIAKAIVEVKAQLEKIREQVQNIE